MLTIQNKTFGSCIYHKISDGIIYIGLYDDQTTFQNEWNDVSVFFACKRNGKSIYMQGLYLQAKKQNQIKQYKIPE